MASGDPEDVIESTICNKAEMDGWLVRKCQWPGRRAAMDRMFAKKGRVLFIEFKAPGRAPNPLQEREIARFRKAGIEVYWFDNIAEGLRILGIK